MANCPIKEQDGDGRMVGRCWHHLVDGVRCPRHGDVSVEIDVFEKEGKMTSENEHRQRLGLHPLGSK